MQHRILEQSIRNSLERMWKRWPLTNLFGETGIAKGFTAQGLPIDIWTQDFPNTQEAF